MVCMRAVFLIVLAVASLAAPGPVVRDMLAAHNAVRQRVGVAPLVWSARLEAVAQAWANTLLARREFRHRPGTELGENLYAVTGASVRATEVVRAWAEEEGDYDPQSNSCRGVCGHYTQIVWRETRELGCAVARGRGREVWVCNYSPAGNWVGQRPY